MAETRPQGPRHCALEEARGHYSGTVVPSQIRAWDPVGRGVPGPHGLLCGLWAGHPRPSCALRPGPDIVEHVRQRSKVRWPDAGELAPVPLQPKTSGTQPPIRVRFPKQAVDCRLVKRGELVR